jgi:Ankyrin repeats (3 copies)
MSTLPPPWDPSDDADEHYRRASELDPSRPSETTRRVVLEHAVRVAAERAGRAAGRRWLSLIGITPGWRPAIIGTLAAAVLVGVVIAPQFLAPIERLGGQRAPAPASPQAASTPASAPAAPAAPEERARPPMPVESASPAAPAVTLQRARVPSRADVAAKAAPAAPAPAPAAGDAITTLQAEQRAEANAARAVAGATASRAQHARPALPSTPLVAGDPEALRQAAAAGDLAALTAQLASGSDIESRDAWGRTALMLATLNGQTQAVNALLARGADPNAADAQGITPLAAAVAADEREIVAALKRHGAR